MNDLDLQNQVNKVTKPDEAVEQFVGDQFIEWAQEYIRHEMKSWPALVQLSTLTVKPDKIKKFMLQIFLADQSFLGGRGADPGLLGFAISNLSESDDPQAEGALEILEKLQAELRGDEVQGTESTAQTIAWNHLLTALGVVESEITRSKLKEPTRNYTSELSDLFSNASWQMTVGAVAAFEWASLEEYKVLAHMLKTNIPLEPKDLSALQGNLDEKRAIDMGRMLEKSVVDRDDKQLVWTGIHRQLLANQEFLMALVSYLE